jgi:hypothetical protein
VRATQIRVVSGTALLQRELGGSKHSWEEAQVGEGMGPLCLTIEEVDVRM